MRTDLSIETLLRGDILLIVLEGSLNGTTTEEFNRATQNHLDQGRSKIIIDCRRVESISSIGLGSLIALQARLRKKGGEVKLAGLYGLAADTIRLVGLDKLLGIYQDAEVARRAFYPDETDSDPREAKLRGVKRAPPFQGWQQPDRLVFYSETIEVPVKPAGELPRISTTPDDEAQPPITQP